MQTDESGSAQLSVVLVAPDSYAMVRRTVLSLAAQTVQGRIELVLVTRDADRLGLRADDLAGFANCLVVQMGTAPTKDGGNAAGVRRASAPIVAFAEDHCFPDPRWGEALIEAHRGPWAAVGPVVGNANPGNAVSWADLLIGYGHWTDPAAGGPVEFLPGHNSSYKREVLLAYGDELDARLQAETVMHWDLRAKGHQLYLDPKARTNHLNFARLGAWTAIQYSCGRVFAAGRAREWSFVKRLIYAAASPLIPLVRFKRIARKTVVPGRPVSAVRIVIAVAYGLLVDGVGQMVGYALGAGKSVENFDDYEFRRYRYVREEDVAAFAPAGEESDPAGVGVAPDSRLGSRRMSVPMFILVLFATLLLAVIGLRKIVPAVDILLLSARADQPIDLRLRHMETREWMAGTPVYEEIQTAMYPPSTYAILWPFIGWTSFEAARVIWAGTCVLALTLLVRFAIVESGVARWPWKLLIGAAVLSNYANAVAIGNGQMSLQVVAAVIGSLLIAMRGRGTWLADVASAALFIVAMAKPQIAIPFWWVLLFAPGRVRPAMLAVLGYVGVTLLAASFQPPGMWAAHLHLFRWAARNGMAEGYGNLNVWLASAGLSWLILPAWIVVLLGSGAWTYVNRRAAPWVLMAVAALVARTWSYHRNYDDVLLVVPVVALAGIAGERDSRRDYWAAGLFAALVLVMIVPARSGRLIEWDAYVTAGHVAVWLGVLGYLLRPKSDMALSGRGDRVDTMG